MNAGDTAWTLVSVALVLLMTPGLAFFYAGLVRERSAVDTLKLCFVAICLVAVEWAVVGYSLAFSEGSRWIGGGSYLFLRGVGGDVDPAVADNVPHLAFMAFQMMFAIITPALIGGAVVGRMRFRAFVPFVLLWSVVVYAPVAHWVWGPDGWIGALGALDFAGGTVVHVTAGVAALVAAAALGPRRGRRAGPRIDEVPHNVPLVVLGTSLLWFGWFGFNAGSALAADGLAATAFVTTMLAAAAAVLAWLAVDALTGGGKSGAVGACIAAIVGLVAVTPAAGFVTPLSALAIGACAAVVSQLAIRALRRTGLEDTLDVFACHGVAGVVGSLLTGVFATTAVNPDGADGLLSGNPALLGVQAVSVLAAGAWAAIGTYGVLRVVRLVTALTDGSEDDERSAEPAVEPEYVIEPGLESLVRSRLAPLSARPRS